MKKFCFIVVLSFLSFRAYGIHNLFINGSSALTVTTVDTLHITASFDGSAVAKATVYYDINDNGQLDPDDPWIFKSKLIDGGFDDEDEIVNGKYHEIYDSLTFQGKFLFYAEDNGVSDTIAVTVTPTSSSHSISGRITEPAEPYPHILVAIIKIVDSYNGKFEYGYGDFTDTNGDYSISIPEKYANQYWSIIALDVAEVVPFCSSNDFLNDSIYISGTVAKNLVMCLAPPDTITEIIGELRDDLGNLITEPARVMGIGLIDGYNRARPGKTDNTGTYKVSIKKATNGCFYAHIVQASIAGQFHPEFTNPIYQHKIYFPPAPSQITMNLKVYRTTNTISGYVYKDGAPYDGCQLDCGGVGYGGTYTKTFSDGHYEMWVSDSCPYYTIKIAPKSIPEGYKSEPRETTAVSGDTGINFNLVKVGIEELSKPQPGITLSVYPNPFMSEVVFELSQGRLKPLLQPDESRGFHLPKCSQEVGNLVLYDIAGNRVTEVKPETQNGLTRFILSSGNKKLPTGIYFYSLRAGNKVLKGKVIKLR